jgi:hypothetical protein
MFDEDTVLSAITYGVVSTVLSVLTEESAGKDEFAMAVPDGEERELVLVVPFLVRLSLTATKPNPGNVESRTVQPRIDLMPVFPASPGGAARLPQDAGIVVFGHPP